MQQINSYIYDNTILVQIDTDSDIIQRNRVVYTRTLTCYQGVDNLIKVKVQNQDQKPYNVTDTTLMFSIIDDYVKANSNVVFQTPVTISNAVLGTGTVVIPAAYTDVLERTDYTYSIYYTQGGAFGNLQLPAYVDDNYGARGQLTLVRGAFPSGSGNLVTTSSEDLGTL